MNNHVSLTHALQFPYVPTTGKESMFILLELSAKRNETFSNQSFGRT
ncbi:hypothetical protein SAMN05421743_102201 [Thalassobacillus cyri]|uniref:Uncharacterized protein n=1 Tax=Thalassobacillus cyri TaxID=571932 RepID=A0A1H3XMK6_9BACI|nr:hypothetical protein [Thalassobacillus cyri]SEA00667.1 hypothetical protein SAMN05421743_102201 [Thalassobacillus cyri]